MPRLVLATRNKGKIIEMRELLCVPALEILGLESYPGAPVIEEKGATYADNALAKAKAIALFTGETALADDSGLEVDALGGAPGVHSARYTSPNGNDRDNVRKLLRELEGLPPGKRTARFVCVLALARPGGPELTVEGRCEGTITTEPRGNGGFGYDPVFLLPGPGLTMAELPAGIKNNISHRAVAAGKLLPVLGRFMEQGPR